MKFFLDTANLNGIREAADFGFADGVTTNPSLIAKEGNVDFKCTLARDGLKATRQLNDEGIRVNVTLCFSPAQAILAAKAGASFISPFLGRLDDIGENGLELLQSIVEIYQNYPWKTEALGASVRNPIHVN